ncbi:MAG: flagellar filament capping protein FliD [Woeseiaceae bacterium]|nr:flagellar filament capping protein FliD [Woeseiaceae bacterium]
MASITSTGIGSGLDVPNLVSQLVAAEAQPTELRIARKEADLQARLSAYGSLKAALTTFQDELDKMKDVDLLLQRSVSVPDDTLLSATADDSALPGSYDIEIQQLAQAQRLQSGAFTGTDAVVGTGTLTITVGSDAFTLDFDDENNTLADIQDAINNATGNTGVTATIVNADSGSYLFLTAENTGSDQTIRVTQTGGDGGLAALEYDPGAGLNALTETAAAQDALVRINGFDITSSTNSVTGAIEGVTLDLLASNVGEPTTISVSNDREAVKAQVEAFVTAYNELIDVFEEQTAFDADAEVAAPLLGDSTVRGVRDQLRRELTTSVTDIDATFDSLLDIGIATDLKGRLEIDSTVLDGVLQSEFSKFGQLFANSDGFAVRLDAVIENYLDETDGILTSRVDGIEASIEDLDDQREALALRLESVEARLLRQFNALDALVGELTTTSNFLTQQLASLPKININRND